MNIENRYKQAKYFAAGSVVKNDVVYPHWVEGSSLFWYRRALESGWEYRLVDAGNKTNVLAFNHDELARAVSDETGQELKSCSIFFDEMTIKGSGDVVFNLFGYQWMFDSRKKTCEKMKVVASEGVDSPDGLLNAFVKEHNVWIKNKASLQDVKITVNGGDYSCFASFPSGGGLPPLAVWSPDSKYILTLQFEADEGSIIRVASYLHGGGDKGPQIIPNTKTFHVGDKDVERVRLLVLDAVTGDEVSLDYPSIPFRNEMARSAEWWWWSEDSRYVYFVAKSMDHKLASVIEADVATGLTRVVFTEASDTFVRMRHELLENLLYRPLPESDEIIWYSERTGSGHLYLYDLKTGQLKNPITDGVGLVRELLHYDANSRELLLSMAARCSDISPYYRQLYKVNIDSGVLTPLAEGPFDHVVADPGSYNLLCIESTLSDSKGISGVSGDGEYVLFTRSRVDTIPESLLVDRAGKVLMEVEVADVSGLPGNWVWPEPVMLKADDGHTDISGVIFRPPGFSPKKKYPVIDYSSSTRLNVQFPHSAFGSGASIGLFYYRASALAALGFIVVMIEGRATPVRDKLFQDHGHGDYSTANELRDHIAGIRQLNKLYPYMDINRVGINGLETFSNIVFSLLKYSHFYKVAVVLCQEDCWSYPMRLLTDEWYGTADPYLADNKSSPSDFVDTFDGKLFLIEGMLSFSIENTFRLIEALQAANKDFDQLFLPNVAYMSNGYICRREWDYLVRHLLGEEPPKCKLDITEMQERLNNNASELMRKSKEFNDKEDKV